MKLIEASRENGTEAGSESALEGLIANSSSSQEMLTAFFLELAGAQESGLFLDFDGTLAPFRIDPDLVRPWAGVTALLEKIQAAGRTRLSIVSGRPADDVRRLLGMSRPPEIWGLHGSERLFPDGSRQGWKLSAGEEAILIEARHAVEGAVMGSGGDLRWEAKANGIAVHWRGLTNDRTTAASLRITAMLEPFVAENGFRLLPFDGGIELRAGRNKGDAVRALLGELRPDAPTAYLGDDLTDEDAFLAIHPRGPRGLAVLVREEPRPTAARLWLRPPDQLREFLRRWLEAIAP